MLEQWYQALGLPIDPEALVLVSALVFARSLPLLFLNPFLGGSVVPGPVKMATAFTFVVLLLPVLSQMGGQVPTGVPYFALLIKELMVGVTLGFVSGLVFLAFSASGRLIDMQRGVNMAETMIFQLKERTSLMGQLYSQSAIILFLLAGGHIVYLRGFFSSFELLPVLEFPSFSGGTVPILTDLARSSADVLLLALQLAAPAVIALFLTDVAFGIINRASPQINVFIVSQPAKVAVGIFFVLVVLRVLVEQYDVHTQGMLVTLYRFIGYMGS